MAESLDVDMELEQQNALLREELEQRKQGGDQLADALAEAQQTIAALQDGHGNGKEIPANPWAMPKVNLLLLVAVIAGWLLVSMRWFGLASNAVIVMWSLPFAALALWRFVIWTRLQYREDGLGPLLIKWVVLAVGLWLVVLTCKNFDGISVWPFLVLAAVVLLMLSRLAEWISEQTTERGWF